MVQHAHFQDYFSFFRASGFLSKNSGGGLAASHSSITAQIGGPGQGAHPMYRDVRTLSSNTLSGQFQTLLPGNAHVCSLDTLPLLKALLWWKPVIWICKAASTKRGCWPNSLKSVRDCDWEHSRRAHPALLLINPSSTAIRCDVREVLMICFITI